MTYIAHVEILLTNIQQCYVTPLLLYKYAMEHFTMGNY